MVERIKITDTTFITRDSNGDITFSADRYYVKNDANGSFLIGGIQYTPILSAHTTVEVAPRVDACGWTVSRDTGFSVTSGTSINSGSFTNIPLYADTFGSTAPSAAQNFGGGAYQGPAAFPRFKFKPYNGSNEVYYNMYFNGVLFDILPLSFIIVEVWMFSGGAPEYLLATLPFVESGFNVINASIMKEGGTLSWSPNYSSYNMMYVTYDRWSEYPINTLSSAGAPGTSWNYGWQWLPAAVQGSPKNVGLVISS